MSEIVLSTATTQHKKDVIKELSELPDATALVEFFKPSGKWYRTEQIPMLEDITAKCLSDGTFHEIVKIYLDGRLSGMTYISTINPFGFPVTGVILEKLVVNGNELEEEITKG